MGVKPGTEKLKRLLEMGMLIILIMDDGNKGPSNRGWPKRSWEKDAEVWMGGGKCLETNSRRSARRSIKTATSGNG